MCRAATANNCRLLYDVSFCPNLAYSVPSPPLIDTASLLSLYNTSIQTSLSAFNLTLSTFPCADPVRKEQGMYSHVRTCSQCMDAYQSWLCAVVMPRCTDPSDSDDSNIPTLQRTSGNTSRTPFLPESVYPYTELPPCIGVCQLVAASCPPIISSAFNCPLRDITLNQSYSIPFQKQIAFNNVQGGDDPAWLGITLQRDGSATRASDRWGNVRCNDMGVSNLLQRRRWSGSSVAAAVQATSVDTQLLRLLIVCICGSILALSNTL